MIREGLTFDDVLLVPQYSEIESRSKDVSVSVNLCGLYFDHPIIPANMKTVTGIKMAEAVCNTGGLPILHRFESFDEQLAWTDRLTHKYSSTSFAVSLGVKPEDLDAFEMFLDQGARVFCIDVAHGDSKLCINMIESMKKSYRPVTIIAGNVATGQGARRLWEAGADIVKVGVGPGSLCTTRIKTGNGVPQLTALMDVYNVRESMRETTPNKGFGIIADGGIKDSGDIVKALCFSDMVMAGNLFAGCLETPGDIITVNGRTYKDYVGSSTHKTNHIEGVQALVPSKGHFKDILKTLVENIQSGCSYQGVRNLNELKENPQLIRITNAGLKESHPHDVIL